jgi:hypothetical protein
MSKVRPLPPHAFNTYRDRIRAHETYMRVYNDGRGYDFGNGSAMGLTPHSVEFSPPLDWTNVYNRALDKLNDQVRGDLNLTVDFAEIHQVTRMLNYKEQLLTFSKKFLSGPPRGWSHRRFGGLGDLSQELANRRLEYMYGVKPLMQSIYGSADELQRLVINKTAKLRVRATDKNYKVNTFRIQCYWGGQNFNAKDVKIKLSTTLGVDVRTDQQDFSRWASLNPIGIAWELMPYSFVIDWFLNVGGYLQNMETYLWNANKFRSGYRTDFAAFEGFGAFSFPIPSGSTGTDQIDANIEGFRLTRQLLTHYPIPYLPRFQANLGSSRLLNGAALLAQLLSRRITLPGRLGFLTRDFLPK